VRKLGDKIIVHRSMHKSVFSAVEIFGIEPIIIGKTVVGDIQEEVSVNEIKEALENNPTAIGVFLNAVDYYGRVPDLKVIKDLVSSHKKLLLLDNAHGAQFKAVGKAYAGDYADLWVDSAHKTLNTLNQGAIVFSNNKGLEESLVSSTAALSSTSPSYPLLASIEYGVKTLFKEIENYKKTEQKVLNLQSALNSAGIVCKIFSDGLKLLVDLFASGIKEQNVEILLNKKGVYPELIGNGYVLFMFSPNNKKKDFTRVFTSLKNLKGEKIDREVKVISPIKKASYFETKNKCTEYIDLKQAEGKICAENAGVFPPCVPIVFAGEIITKEIIKVLESKNVFGIKNGKIKIVI
jgi:lysine decarboxylase